MFIIKLVLQISATDMDNTALDPIVNALPNVVNPGSSHRLPSFTVNDILPKDRHAFWRYQGSLTTPGCAEVVTWSVIQEVSSLSQSQVIIQSPGSCIIHLFLIWLLFLVLLSHLATYCTDGSIPRSQVLHWVSHAIALVQQLPAHATFEWTECDMLLICSNKLHRIMMNF